MVHHQESGLDQNLTEPVLRLLKELSNGIGLLNRSDIEMSQTTRALRRYLDLEAEPEDYRWQHAFFQDPHTPIHRPRVYVYIPTPTEFAEEDGRRKQLIQSFRMKTAVSVQGAKRPTFWSTST